MECPHCRAEIEEKPHVFALGIDPDGEWKVSSQRCHVCDRLIVRLLGEAGIYPVRPAGLTRAPLDAAVPADWAAAYRTASELLPYSEEASAAVSRRLLHRVLAACAQAGYGGLSDQIQRAVASPALPDYLKEALSGYARLTGLESDQVRSYRPDALVPAVAGEADWLLDLLESLFDFYYVQPARLKRKLDRLKPPGSATDPGAAVVDPAPALSESGAASGVQTEAATAPAEQAADFQSKTTGGSDVS